MRTPSPITALYQYDQKHEGIPHVSSESQTKEIKCLAPQFAKKATTSLTTQRILQKEQLNSEAI